MEPPTARGTGTSPPPLPTKPATSAWRTRSAGPAQARGAGLGPHVLPAGRAEPESRSSNTSQFPGNAGQAGGAMPRGLCSHGQRPRSQPRSTAPTSAAPSRRRAPGLADKTAGRGDRGCRLPRPVGQGRPITLGQRPCPLAHNQQEQQQGDADYRRLWFNDVSARSHQSADARHTNGLTRPAEDRQAPRNTADATPRLLPLDPVGCSRSRHNSAQGRNPPPQGMFPTMRGQSPWAEAGCPTSGPQE